MSLLSQLQARAIPNVAEFDEGQGGLLRLRVHTRLSDAEIYLQGAHLTHFQCAGSAPLLFVSGASTFAPGRAIRGGVPVCFPWFAGREGSPQSPSHGFARTKVWTLENIEGSDEAGVRVVFVLENDAETQSHWPHEFRMRLSFDLRADLRLSLEVENTSSESFRFEEALHTYLTISDIHNVSLLGVEGAVYLDKTDHGAPKHTTAGPLVFSGEMDAVFLDHRAGCRVLDEGMGRELTVDKSGSDSTVVWNPWIKRAAALADLGDEEWVKMLCVESANLGSNAIMLAPGDRHQMEVHIRVAPLRSA